MVFKIGFLLIQFSSNWDSTNFLSNGYVLCRIFSSAIWVFEEKKPAFGQLIVILVTVWSADIWISKSLCCAIPNWYAIKWEFRVLHSPRSFVVKVQPYGIPWGTTFKTSSKHSIIRTGNLLYGKNRTFGWNKAVINQFCSFWEFFSIYI